MFPRIKMEEHTEYEIFGTFWAKKYRAWVPKDPFYAKYKQKYPQGYWNRLYYFDFENFVFQIFLPKVLKHFPHPSSHPILEQIFTPFDCLWYPWCKFPCKFSIIGLNYVWYFPVKFLVSI